MSAASWWEVTLAAAALALAGVAATVETLTSLIGRQRLRQLAEEGRARRTVAALLEPGRAALGGLHLVQAIGLVVAASLATTVAGRELATGERLVAVLAVTAGFVLVGLAVPRTLARYRPERSLGLLLALVTVLTTLVRPVWLASDLLSRGLARVLPDLGPEAAPVGTEDELRAVTLSDHDSGVIEADEREMIEGILHLEEIRVREIMVPRVDIVAVERSVPPDELLQRIIAVGHSRLPVYRENIDQIDGVLYAKDLLPFVIGTTEALPLASLLRRPYFVPESKRLDDLLAELQRERVHIAIVVDEYGGTAGLVTIEDILEEIVGEIQDEYDTEAPLFEVVRPDELVADGRLALEDVAETFGLRFEEDDYDTLGGFVQKRLGRLPIAGDAFEAEGVRVEVQQVEHHRVRRMRVIRLSPAGGAETDDERGPVSAPERPADGPDTDRPPVVPPPSYG